MIPSQASDRWLFYVARRSLSHGTAGEESLVPFFLCLFVCLFVLSSFSSFFFFNFILNFT